MVNLKSRFEALFDPTGTAFISDSTWLHETVFLAGLNANGWDCSTRTLVAILLNYQQRANYLRMSNFLGTVLRGMMKNLNPPFNFIEGYFILELMLSILIIGILAAIAIPIYTSYLEKAKITEAITLMSGVKSDIAEYYSIYGRLPTKAEQLPYIITSGQYTSNLTLDNGVLTASMRHNDFSLSFRPALANNELPKVITYVCGYATPPNHFIVQGENKTNIPPHYLSLTCR